MAAIECPDCSGTVSNVAETCPHCGRPSPGKSIAAIEADNHASFWGLVWIANALLCFWKLGIGWGIGSLVFGPLIWIFWSMSP